MKNLGSIAVLLLAGTSYIAAMPTLNDHLGLARVTQHDIVNIILSREPKKGHKKQKSANSALAANATATEAISNATAVVAASNATALAATSNATAVEASNTTASSDAKKAHKQDSGDQDSGDQESGNQDSGNQGGGQLAQLLQAFEKGGDGGIASLLGDPLEDVSNGGKGAAANAQAGGAAKSGKGAADDKQNGGLGSLLGQFGAVVGE